MYISIIKIILYICTASLITIFMFTFYLSWNMSLFHSWNNMEGRIGGCSMASWMASSPWKILFSDIFYDDPFLFEVKLKLCLTFQHFQNDRPFDVPTPFFTGSYTRSWIYQQDSHGHNHYFEILINAVAEILTEICQLQNLIEPRTGRTVKLSPTLASWKYFSCIFW